MRKIFVLLFAASLCFLSGCNGKNKNETDVASVPEETAENYSYLVPDGTTVESGEVVDDGEPLLPSEEELGEYEEILMEGDIVDDETRAGYVVAISLKDITVNTYNELTTYTLGGDAAKNTALRLKPDDAVFFNYTTDDETGEKTIYKLGRVRIEDEPVNIKDIKEMYDNADNTNDTNGESEPDEQQ